MTSGTTIDEDLAEYQHKTGVLNVRYAVRHYVRTGARERGEQLFRELAQQCDALARGLSLSPKKAPRARNKDVVARPDG